MYDARLDWLRSKRLQGFKAPAFERRSYRLVEYEAVP
jgi:hypothetical protein